MNLITYCIFIFGTVLFGVKTEKSIDNSSKDRKYYLVKTKKSHNKVNQKLPVSIDKERRKAATKYIGP